MILIPFLVYILVIVVFYDVFIRRKWLKKRKHLLADQIPGHTPLPIIGDFHRFSFFTKPDPTNYINMLVEDCKLFPKIQRYWIGPKLIVRLSDSKYVEKILTHPAAKDKPKEQFAISRRFFDGPLVNFGKKAETQRKDFFKFTKTNHIKMYHSSFVKQSNLLCKHLANHTNKEMDIYPYMAELFIHNCCETFFGNSLCEYGQFDTVNAIKECSNILFRFLMNPVSYYVDLLLKRSRGYKEVQRLSQIIYKLVDDAVEDRLRHYKSNIQKEEDPEELYIDFLIKLWENNEITKNTVCSNAAELMMEFVLTASPSTASTLLFLSMFPEVQQKVWKEQLKIFGNSEKVLTLNDLSDMEYLTRVIKESLRLISVPVVMRHISREIDVDKYVLPKGSSVIILLKAVHMDPQVWKEPHLFDPDRFLQEKPKGSFIPFTLGPRSCPGYQIGINSIKTIISSIVRNFKLSTTLKYEDINYKVDFVQIIKENYPIKLERRLQN